MKKKILTVNEIEKKIKEIGGIEIPEKEFDTSDEYKNISSYVKQIMARHKKIIISKAKSAQH